MADQTRKIIYTDNSGALWILTPAPQCPLTVEEIAAKDVRDAADTYEIVNESEIPYDMWVLRDSFKRGEQGKKVGIEMGKARDIAHVIRRKTRDIEMAPYDDIIAKQVPGTDPVGAETARAALRNVYDNLQTQIDNSQNPNALMAIINVINNRLP